MSCMDNNLFYFFQIKLKNGKKIFLTSANERKMLDKNLYLPQSGLSLKQGFFNDSGQNNIIIHGIFENDGITKNTCIENAIIKISYCADGKNTTHLVSYICTQFLVNDLEFEITAESEAVKYNQQLLQMFSKNCRADFGDKKCKININNFALKTKIEKIYEDYIECNTGDEADNYFQNGFAQIFGKDGEMYKLKISTHNKNKLKLELNGSILLSEGMNITLLPSCDKTIHTCRENFNNVVNFRGEPFVPQHNVIRN